MQSTADEHSFLHLDLPLLAGLISLCGIGLIVLYSAGGEDSHLLWRQAVRMAMGFGVMFFLAQIPTYKLLRWTPWFYVAGLGLLFAVLLAGDVGKGAQRWLDFGFIRFQPSELMKLFVPMMVAWYLADKPLPPGNQRLLVAAVLFILPAFLIIKQPDLGTALLIAVSGVFVILLAGMSWRLVLGFAGAGMASVALILFTPLSGKVLHEYQWQRIKTLFNPEQDPLGSGYHIIQSKIAIGSGGLFGKGWGQGTQSHLEFLPERSTDFIFAVISEEFGLLGVLLLLSIYLLIIARGLYISTRAQGMFARLLAGSVTLTFFIYIFVNIGMVSGILPVVGVPLPLISYGGTSLVTLLAGFGLIMGAHSHRRLLSGRL